MTCFFCGPISETDVLEHQASEAHKAMVELVYDLDGRNYCPPIRMVEVDE